MKKHHGWLLAGIALLACSARAATDPVGSSKTPEQVTSLYIRTMNGDTSAGNALGGYLGSAIQQGRIDDLVQVSSRMRKVAEGSWANVMRKGLPQNDDAANKAVQDVTRAQFSAINRSVCQPTRSNIAADAHRPGEFIARVTYQCHMPDIAKIAHSLGESWNAPPTVAFYEKLARALNTAPADKVLNGEFELYSDRARHIWWSNTPPDIRLSVMMAILFSAEK